MTQPNSDSGLGEETIVAVASPRAPAPRGIVRLSGADVSDVLSSMGLNVPRGHGRPTRFSDEVDLGIPLGCIPVDVLYWPTQRSYTGSPSAELQCLGCQPVLTSLVELATKSGARAARPGEFTMRSFMAGRIDLVQAEAVLGVIEADDARSLDRALEQLAGNLSRPLLEVRQTLMNLIADVEAGLDFVDEDIEFITDQVLADRIREATETVREASRQLSHRGPGRSATRVVLVGYPNAGKSRLLNALTGQDAVIVSPQAGTTRDVVEVDSMLGGRPFRWVDTAGFEFLNHDGNQAAIKHAAEQLAVTAAADADIRLWCVDGSAGGVDEILDRLRSHESMDFASGSVRPSSKDLYLATKSDLGVRHLETKRDWLPISSQTGDGLDVLRRQLVDLADTHDRDEIGGVMGTAARCGDAIQHAIESLTAAGKTLEYQAGHELIAGELRLAVESIGEVTGQICTDDILDRIFSRFCIGK
ncbi:MAG: tRNA modification GTPase [Planctomycetota bacterium]